MTDQFAFLGDKCKVAIAVAMSLGVLLLLPASLGYGGTISYKKPLDSSIFLFSKRRKRKMEV